MALSDSLVSYWSLDEASGNALDAHGSSPLTETSGTIASTAGKVGNARDFELSDTEYFEATDSAALSVGDIDFTFIAWVNFESLGAGTADLTIVGKGGVSDLPYALDYEASGGNSRFRFRVSSAAAFTNLTAVVQNIFGPASLATWYFVVGWHDSVNNLIGISVNDSAVTAAYSSGSYDDGGTFQIGAFPFYGNYFDGLIDEVGFWKRVLTASERTDLYNSGNGRSYAYIIAGAPQIIPSIYRKIMRPRRALESLARLN